MSPNSLALSHSSSAPQMRAGILWNNWPLILLKWNCNRLPRKNWAGNWEEKLNWGIIPNHIMATLYNKQLLVHQHGNMPLPSLASASPQEDTQGGLMATKWSLSPLMVGPAPTRKNILSDKNSQLEGDDTFSFLSSLNIHTRSFLRESNHLCYSLLVGGKAGSSILENVEEMLPCLFSKGETASKEFGRELLHGFSQKMGTEVLSRQAFGREGRGMMCTQENQLLVCHLELQTHQVHKGYIGTASWWRCSLWFHATQVFMFVIFLEAKVRVAFGSHKACHMLRMRVELHAA